jgi:membrane protein DedA with SNARE-associated domain
MKEALELLKSHGYAAVFIIVFLDQAWISMPSPPFVTAMGALSASGHFNPWLAVITVFGAASLADALWYRVGRSGRLSRFRQYVSRSAGTKGARVANIIGRGMLGGLFTVKFSFLPSAVAPLLAGTTEFPGFRFVLYAAFANFAWTSLFFFGGFLGVDVAVRWFDQIKGLLHS